MKDNILPDFDIWKQISYKDMKWVTIERLSEIISNNLQELEMLQYAEGWQQTGDKGSSEDLVHVFNQDFKAYCQNLEQTRLLPFNFF